MKAVVTSYWTIADILQALHARGFIENPARRSHLMYNDGVGRKPLDPKLVIGRLRLGSLPSFQDRFRTRGGSAQHSGGPEAAFSRLGAAFDSTPTDEGQSTSAEFQATFGPDQFYAGTISGCPAHEGDSSSSMYEAMHVDAPLDEAMHVDSPDNGSLPLPEYDEAGYPRVAYKFTTLRKIRDINYDALQHAAAFAVQQRLVFLRAPQTSGVLVHSDPPPGTARPHPNTGPFSLEHHVRCNQDFLRYERWLHSTISEIHNLGPFDREPLISESNSAIATLDMELDRLDTMKEIEWERQRRPEVSIPDVGSVPLFDNSEYDVIDYNHIRAQACFRA